MEVFSFIWNYGIMFLVVLTVLVFVHEFGHYWVARRNGVRIEVFSIGFGRELFGFTDRAGTRWKFSLIPLGGYVKMYGDADASSRPGAEVRAMTEEERAVSFFHKRLGQKAAIVAAGPMANFLFTVLALALLFSLYGQPFTPPVIQEVQPDGAAAEAGIQPGDRVLRINGDEIERFEEVQQFVAMYPGMPMDILVERNGAEHRLTVTPRAVQLTDRFGNTHKIGRLGVLRAAEEYRKYPPLTAVWKAGGATVDLVELTLTNIWQIAQGVRSTEELGGPIRIAQMSGQVAQISFSALLWFMAVLSVSLGLINLFPVPMLDGGHLLYYAIEAIRGRPLGERTQEYGFRIGLALVLTLMVFTTWNDLVHLRVVEFFRDLLS